jgi:hypothetical protein
LEDRGKGTFQSMLIETGRAETESTASARWAQLFML